MRENPYAKNPPACISSHVNVVALVQCERDGAGLAEILNWIGEARARTPEWMQAFDRALNEHGLCALREIATPTLAAGEAE